jgi:hypothetical protein
MTANQMADMLEEKLDRADSFGSPGYEDFDLTSVLTEAQDLYVKKFFDEMNNRKQKGFEETEISNNVSGTFYDLPDDHMYTIYEECTIDKKECDTGAFIIGWVNVVAQLLTMKCKGITGVSIKNLFTGSTETVGFGVQSLVEKSQQEMMKLQRQINATSYLLMEHLM